jgi:hypothetical protein
MDQTQNPYSAPAPDRKVELRAKMRRRKVKYLAQAVALFVLLFPAYWGVRILLGLFNQWLLGD